MRFFTHLVTRPCPPLLLSMASPDQHLQFVTLDVFTQHRYAGNPLAVVRVPASVVLTQGQKQLIAREFNYSETVILHESGESYRQKEWTIDIFLTTAEITLAGHPVIGTVCYLGQALGASAASGTISGTLKTKAGKVPFTYDAGSKRAEVEIPHDVHVHPKTLTANEAIQHGIPEEVHQSLKRPAPVVSIVKGMTFCLVELPSLEALAKLRPNLKDLSTDGLDREYHPTGVVGFFFYVKQGTTTSGIQKLRTRMIEGSQEDPATGSASSALAAYLAFYADPTPDSAQKVHKFELTQGVEMGRESVIVLEVSGRSASQIEKVKLSGNSIHVMEGSLVVPV